MSSKVGELHIRRLLRVTEAARYLGICRSTLYSRIHGGLIPYVKTGPGRSGIRLDLRDLDEWIEEHRINASRKPSRQITK